jgi:hypothetical protein
MENLKYVNVCQQSNQQDTCQVKQRPSSEINFHGSLRLLQRFFVLGLVVLGLVVGSFWTSSALAQTKDILASMVLTCAVGQGEVNPPRLIYTCRTNNDKFNGLITVYSDTPLPNVPIDRMEVEPALWVFDHQADGRPELVLHLYQDEQGSVADVFDRNAPLSAVVGACCDEAALRGFNPTIQVRAVEGWTTDKGTNFNLDIAIDGDVYTLFGGTEKLRRRLATEEQLRTDGTTDYTISIRDPDKNGRPDYEFRKAQLPDLIEQKIQSGGRALERTAIMVNEEDNEPPLRKWIPWPYLGPLTYGYLTNSYSLNNYPPIQVDWETGLIPIVGEFVRSRGNDNQWFSYAFRELVLGQSNVLDFEFPFAFYGLVDDKGETPDLAIRFLYTPPFSNNLYVGGYPYPLTNIRYTWKQYDGQQWRRYKFALLGQQAPEHSEVFDEFTLQTFAPYQELPSWVTGQTWGAVAFVAEMNGKNSTPVVGEGMNEWDAVDISRGKFINYFLGTERNRTVALQGTRLIREGLRGEYALTPNQKVLMYFSPVDRHLHLKGAEAGIWNIDGVNHMRYDDLDKDGYFDSWTLLERTFEALPETTTPIVEDPKFTDALKEQFITANGYVIYATQSGVTLRQTQVQPVLFESSPPTDPASWQTLGAQLGEDRPFRPYELIRSLNRFQGPTLSLPGASFSHYQVLGGGSFSFILDTQDAPQDPLLPLQVGRNLYTYTPATQSWTVESVRDEALTATLNTESFYVLEPATLELGLTNPSNLTLSKGATLYLGREAIESWPLLSIPAENTLRQSIPWVPSERGEIEARLEFDDGTVLPLGVLQVTNPAREEATEALRLSLPTASSLLLVTLGLASLILLVLTWRLLWHP